MMTQIAVTVVTLMLVVAQLPISMTHPPTAPAFLWSPHQDGFLNNGIKEAVNYQILSSKDLAKSVLSEGGWSNLLCSGKEAQQPVDLALVFVGRELQSSDISGASHAESALVDLLKVSFTRANFSLAFPYIDVSEEEEAIESLLVSEFTETCGHNFGASKVTFLDSCSVNGGNYEKLPNIHAVHDYLVSRMEQRPKRQTDLVVVCQGNSRTERDVFSDLISSVEQSGARYTVLHVSNPFRSIQYHSDRDLVRFLADTTSQKGPDNSTFCDEVCRIKSSLMEGILVGIVLLIILISGLCCMMGIDTPTRFEAPQDS